MRTPSPRVAANDANAAWADRLPLWSLTRCLTPDAVLGAIQAAWSEHPDAARWRAVRQIEALVHPDRYARVAYALLPASDLPPERWWPEGQLAYIHAPVRQPASRRGRLLTINGLAAEAYLFPNDRRLRGLRHFAGKPAAHAAWQAWLDERGLGLTLADDDLQRQLVRYVPEQKWIVRLRGRVRDGQGDETLRRIAVRSADAGECRRLASRHEALAEAAAASNGLFRVPPVEGLDEARGLLAVEWIRGEGLLTALRGDAARVLARVADILGHVHALRLPGLPRLTPEAQQGSVRAAADDLAAALPRAAGRVRRLAGALGAVLGELPAPCRLATLHNDFHWNQLRIKHDRFVLLDFERMAIGDALVDVARFVTELRMLPGRPEHAVAAAGAEGWASAFLGHWRRGAGADENPRALAAYCGVAAFELARGMLRHLRPEWEGLAAACLDEIERLLARPSEATR